MKLYSAWYCPFAQRTIMALSELGIEYELIETDPYQKTPEWMSNSLGTGQVPVLVEGNLHVPDSLRILDYLEDRFGGARSLFGIDVEERAHARFWIDFAGRKIIPNFYRFLKSPIGSEVGRQARHELELNLKKFAHAMTAKSDYFSGDELGAVDISVFPFAYRIKLLLEYYRNYSTPKSGEVWKRYDAWFAANIRHRSFLSSKFGKIDYDAQLIDFYLIYAEGGGQRDVTQAAG